MNKGTFLDKNHEPISTIEYRDVEHEKRVFAMLLVMIAAAHPELGLKVINGEEE